jgi:hypothetical protein
MILFLTSRSPKELISSRPVTRPSCFLTEDLVLRPFGRLYRTLDEPGLARNSSLRLLDATISRNALGLREPIVKPTPAFLSPFPKMPKIREASPLEENFFISSLRRFIKVNIFVRFCQAPIIIFSTKFTHFDIFFKIPYRTFFIVYRNFKSFPNPEV